MINLLPDEHKSEIRAGRTNVLLVRYITILLLAAVVLGGLIAGSYFVLNATKDNAEREVTENQNSVTGYADINAQTDAFRSDLTIAKSVMDRKVSYAKLIYKIADIVPKNVVLDSLNLDPKVLGSSATMNASAKTFDDATRLKDAFIRNGDIFSNVQFQTLNNSGSEGGTSQEYPVKVNLSIVINKGALQQ